MNILLTQTNAPRPVDGLYSMEAARLACKLQHAATGHMPHHPAMVFLTIAHTLERCDDVWNSVMASMEALA